MRQFDIAATRSEAKWREDFVIFARTLRTRS